MTGEARLRIVGTLVLAALLLACGAGDGEEDRPVAPAVANPAPPSSDLRPSEAGPTPESPDAGLRIVFLGDSLTAGLGLAEDDAYPALVARRLREAGIRAEVVNAGVSGDTSAGGLRRLEWLLRQEPDVVVVALGANDGLRGRPLESVEDNLREIVLRSRAAEARVLLAGIRIPTSYGDAYSQEFAAVFPRIADDLDVPSVPFLLEGVAGRPELNLPDGVHPNAEGHRRIADTVTPVLLGLLSAERNRAAGVGGSR